MANTADTLSSSPKESPAPHSYSQAKQENGQVSGESSSSEAPTRDLPTPIISKLLKGKTREWEAVRSKPGPLHLLDLPVDILRLIVKEITYTNDLTSLALTNSTLYNLAVPHIYSRFDIVWPDASVPATDSKSVDALTYGLSTLCLGSRFAQTSRWLRRASPAHHASSQRLVGNQYAKYTRKFSLGNGPHDLTSEYMITKESGKMLGTLVALAVAKMVNLETFVWDMPTGVLSDIFASLASLQDHYEDGESKLTKLWVRWHDNSDSVGLSSSMSSPIQHPGPPQPISVPSPASGLGSIGHTASISAEAPMRTGRLRYADSHVEYPTFSILPPLTSLTVLDIDELAYLDEMSILIERSVDCLQELRVGISQKAYTLEFAQTWDGINLQQVDHDARWPGESRIGEKRLGGVLGVLVGRIYDIRRKTPVPAHGTAPASAVPSYSLALTSLLTDGGHVSDEGPSSSQAFLPPAGAYWPPNEPRHHKDANQWYEDTSIRGSGLDRKLKLRTLALERVALSMQVCTRAIDWRGLTNLTILNCTHHETLWKVLKRQYQPTSPQGSPAGTPAQYHLALKHIHVDVTSASLISFIKETLAPNTLEVLFLQDRRRSGLPSVTIDQIFKGAIKRHRSSLKKLLIDSSAHKSRAAGLESGRWMQWVLSTEMVTYITSGRMANLKELAVAFDYKDWHIFLQRLMYIPQLRSLHIPHISEHVAGTFEPKELVLQLVDILTLRPEIQLCYVGISNKCFEILEVRRSDHNASDPHGHHQHGHGGMVIDVDDEDDEEGGSVGDEETEDEDEGHDDAATDAEDDFSEGSDDGESDADSFQEEYSSESAPRLRLREILFYDDKVAIFKARHGHL
ncbi:hypothetical protein F4780DRAFT_770208 [Xylariomycetidae sp. FL0641]|nr:hypothetical protein F4780DRAFT_770208 [Xylariomycetidae sp. FL0641]